jgi:hypothetical protein
MIDLNAGRFEEARTRLQEAILCQKKALAANPDHPSYRQFLIEHLVNLIRAAEGLGDETGAGEAQEELDALR